MAFDWAIFIEIARTCKTGFALPLFLTLQRLFPRFLLSVERSLWQRHRDCNASLLSWADSGTASSGSSPPFGAMFRCERR